MASNEKADTPATPPPTPTMETKTVTGPNSGLDFKVYVQGARSSSEVVILTVHDLGCNHTQYQDFVGSDVMQGLGARTVWVHVDLPGQQPDAPDLPASATFPTMQQLGTELVCVLDELKVKEVVCFGEGAGANILARFAMVHSERVLGICLMHCTGTTAGFMESIKDKLTHWKLEKVGMNPTAEAYLVLHRYGSSSDNADQLRHLIENYQLNLRKRTNPKNLKKFVDAFLKRTSIAENIKKLQCPILMITGAKSVFSSTTKSLHQALVKQRTNKGTIEFIEVADVANVLDEKPAKLAESFLYFLQGLGLVSSIPMHHVHPVKKLSRMRSMSMEEYDLPKLRQRSYSGDAGMGGPLAEVPPASEGAQSGGDMKRPVPAQ